MPLTTSTLVAEPIAYTDLALFAVEISTDSLRMYGTFPEITQSSVPGSTVAAHVERFIDFNLAEVEKRYGLKIKSTFVERIKADIRKPLSYENKPTVAEFFTCHAIAPIQEFFQFIGTLSQFLTPTDASIQSSFSLSKSILSLHSNRPTIDEKIDFRAILSLPCDSSVEYGVFVDAFELYARELTMQNSISEILSGIGPTFSLVEALDYLSGDTPSTGIMGRAFAPVRDTLRNQGFYPHHAASLSALIRAQPSMTFAEFFEHLVGMVSNPSA